jgi:hypothetical protein
VPFAYLLARRVGIDVRARGSGNVGAANVLRTTGTGRAIAVMALDVAKGAAAVAVAQATIGAAPLAGTAAVVGHIYPVWLRFHGGKGVAVAAGAFGMLTPVATAIHGRVRSCGRRIVGRRGADPVPAPGEPSATPRGHRAPSPGARVTATAGAMQMRVHRG